LRSRNTLWSLLAVLSALLLAFGAAACGGDDGGDNGNGGAQETETEEQQEAVKVGLVSDVGRFNDRSFNQSALEGLNRARDDLGAEVRAVESRAAGDYVPNLTTLVRQDFDVSIGVGFLLAEGVNTVARQFPDSNFAIIDYSVQAPPFTGGDNNAETPENVQGLVFATNENSYLIGCMAAMMVKEAGGPQVISAVGGLDIPTVTIFIAGYRAGAQECNPDIEVLVGFSQDFVAQDKCKEVALNQLSRGSQVVFQVAGGCGLGALDAAREQGKWGIGVDRDQSDLGEHILTSAVKRVDVAVFETIKAVQEGRFQGGTDALFDLENEGVAVGEVSDEVPQEILDRVEELRQQIIAGEITPPTEL
jgi:basic membrane protein A and related proteins